MRPVFSVVLFLSAPAGAAPWSGIDDHLADDDCLLVPDGLTLEIDRDLTLTRLVVHGVVEVTGAGITIAANEIRVGGAQGQGGRFTAGTRDAAHTDLLQIELGGLVGQGCADEWMLTASGGVTDADRALDVERPRALYARGTGRIELWGEDRITPWTSLPQTVPAGATALPLPAGTNWRRGAQVVLAPTDFDPTQDEVRTLGRKSGSSFALTGGALEHDHYVSDPGLQSPDAVPVQGEVALLSRGIQVYDPAPIPVSSDRRDCDGAPGGDHLQFDGAEILVEEGASAALGYIEVFNGGKFDRLGRYPIHFHRVGDASGSVVQGVSVHTSANRGIVGHGVQGLRVADSVVHDVAGHGFYLEEDHHPHGAPLETKENRLEGNLAVRVHGCPNDADDRDDTEIHSSDDARSSGFFWTDPRNALVGNHAAGAFAAGFWWDGGTPHNGSHLCGGATLHAEGGPSSETLPGGVVYPNGYAYLDYQGVVCEGAFVDNVAHGNDVGLWAEQHKDEVVRFLDFTAYKNRSRGTELKNHGVTELIGLMAADNPLTVWPASHAFHIDYDPRYLVLDSVIVGESANRPHTYPPGDAGEMPFYGVEVYEGRLLVERTHFEGYDRTSAAPGPRAAFGRHQTFPFYTNDADNAAGDVTFGPGVRPLWFDDPTLETRPDRNNTVITGASGFQSVLVRDLDGAIGGTPLDWIVARDDFLIPGQAGALGPGVTALDDANAFKVDHTTWGYGQLVVEWCADTYDGWPVDDPAIDADGDGFTFDDERNDDCPQHPVRCNATGWDPTPADASACTPNVRGTVLPSTHWVEGPEGKNRYDVVYETEFVDYDDCTGPACTDRLDAKHHVAQGTHRHSGANVYTPGRYLVDFYDHDQNALVGPGLDSVQAMELRFRDAPVGEKIQVAVAVPEEPVCAYAVDASPTPTCRSLGGNDWLYWSGRAIFDLEIVDGDAVVVMAFGQNRCYC